MDLVIFILGIIVDAFTVLFFLGILTYINVVIFKYGLGLLMMILTKPFRKEKFEAFWRDFEIDLYDRRKKIFIFYSEYLPWVVILICFSLAYWLVNSMGVISTFTSNFS